MALRGRVLVVVRHVHGIEEIIENEDAHRRGEISGLLSFANEGDGVRYCPPALARNLLQRGPKGRFEADAGLSAAKNNRVLIWMLRHRELIKGR